MAAKNLGSCSTCGYSWVQGRDGSHHCAAILQSKYNRLLSLVSELLYSDGKEDEYHSIPYHNARKELKAMVEADRD